MALPFTPAELKGLAEGGCVAAAEEESAQWIPVRKIAESQQVHKRPAWRDRQGDAPVFGPLQRPMFGRRIVNKAGSLLALLSHLLKTCSGDGYPSMEKSINLDRWLADWWLAAVSATLLGKSWSARYDDPHLLVAILTVAIGYANTQTDARASLIKLISKCESALRHNVMLSLLSVFGNVIKTKNSSNVLLGIWKRCIPRATRGQFMSGSGSSGVRKLVVKGTRRIKTWKHFNGQNFSISVVIQHDWQFFSLRDHLLVGEMSTLLCTGASHDT